MVRGGWDRQKMQESDRQISRNFAHEFIESLKRGIKSTQQPIVDEKFKDREGELSHENIFSETNNTITRNIQNTPDHSKITTDHFVVQYICDRNKLFENEFRKNWDRIEDGIFRQTAREMKRDFKDQLECTLMVIKEILYSLNYSKYDKETFDSDNIFEIVNLSTFTKDRELTLNAKESPFKAMVMYLRMYLDPKVTSEKFYHTFKHYFRVDGIEMKASNASILCEKKQTPTDERK